MFASACDGEAEGDALDTLGDALGDCVEVGNGVGIGKFELGIASEFGVVKKGTKLTVPMVKSSLKS